jgi:hypothetical protein
VIGWQRVERREGGEDLPWSHTIHDDLAGADGEHGGHFPNDEHLQQLRDVVTIVHIRLFFVGEGRKELAGRRISLLELGDLVQLRSGHGEVGVRVIFLGRLAELRVKETSEQGKGDDVRGDHLFVIFSHLPLSRASAGVSNEHVEAGQLGFDSVREGLNGGVRAHVQIPHLKSVC